MPESKTCQAKRYDGSPCGREVFNENDKHCIFHSEDIEGKEEKFDEAFRKEFNKQNEDENIKVLDFSYFVFPNDFRFFREEEIQKSITFCDTTFLFGADFSRAKFSSTADFSRAIFYEADFRRATFSSEADFFRAKFSSRPYFWRATFLFGADFSRAKFSSTADFSDAYFEDVEGLFDIGVLIYRSKLLGKIKYKINNFLFTFGHEASTKYPCIHRISQDEWFLKDFKTQHPFIFKIWWLFADCGRSLFRWAFWSFLISVGFAYKFVMAYGENIEAFKFAVPPESLITFLYYSVVTFTTLGFGDVIPATEPLKIWVMAEVILGYIMLGGLISIFANKLARRS